MVHQSIFNFITLTNLVCEISGYHHDSYQNQVLLGYCTASTGWNSTLFWDISSAPSGFKKNAWYNWFGWIHRLRCGRSLVFQTTSVNFNSLTLCNSRCTRFCNTMWSAQITNFSMNYLLTLFILLRCIYSNYQKKTIYKPWREREREVMFY